MNCPTRGFQSAGLARVDCDSRSTSVGRRGLIGWSLKLGGSEMSVRIVGLGGGGAGSEREGLRGYLRRLSRVGSFHFVRR